MSNRGTIEFASGFSRAGRALVEPVNAALSDSEFYYRQIVCGLRDYASKIGFRQVVIGCSGGID